MRVTVTRKAKQVRERHKNFTKCTIRKKCLFSKKEMPTLNNMLAAVKSDDNLLNICF
jgi:hypothetical protein